MALHLPPNPSLHPCPSIHMHCHGLGCVLHCCHIGDSVPPHCLLCWLDCCSALALPLARRPFVYSSCMQMGEACMVQGREQGVGGWGDSIPLTMLM